MNETTNGFIARQCDSAGEECALIEPPIQDGRALLEALIGNLEALLVERQKLQNKASA